MKRVVNNPYHLWAHQVQSDARNSSGNRSFIGEHAYSYAACIGSIVENAKGEQAYILASDSWTVTTSRHQSKLRDAIPRGSVVFYVPFRHAGGWNGWEYHGNAEDHGRTHAYYCEKIAEFTLKAKRARTEHNRNYYAMYAANTLDELRRYRMFFGLKGKRYALPSEANTAATMEALNAAREAAAAREREAARKARERNADTIGRWIAGEAVYVPHTVTEAYLRLSADGLTVETSQGADAPLEHVLRALPFVLECLQHGRAWQPNGHTIHLGHYAVRSIDADGTLRVGCHVFAKSEVLRFAALVTA